MTWSLEIILLACCGAFTAGFVDAIAGGGGVIALPVLLLLGLPPQNAIATNKLVSTFGASAASLTFLIKKRVELDVIKTAIFFSGLGAAIGVLLVNHAPTQFLKPFISFIIFTLAIYFFTQPKLGLIETFTHLTPSSAARLRFFALIIGFYDGFIGPGTGSFLMYFFVRWMGFDFLTAAGNTRVLNWASNIVSLILFALAGNVIVLIGLPMAFANMVGGALGAQFAIKRGVGWVRWIFVVMALLLAIKQLIR